MTSTLIIRTDIERFMDLAETIPVIDVRSPSEFLAGHIPGAVSIPLFNDDERAAIGKKYKNEGRIPAIIDGLQYSGPGLSASLRQALKIAKNGKILVHCWRGGMRSEAMAWLFSLGGIHTEILDGGYKAYRNYILDGLSEKRKTIILGGMTGSGKTHILRQLKKLGQQTIDLEGLANHKGSAFGSLGQPSQPSTEHFGNILYSEWHKLDRTKPVWLEDESRNIGSVYIPDRFYLNMQDTPVVILIMNVATRLPRLMEEYSAFSAEALKSSIMKISKRLGGDSTRDAISAVEAGDFARAVEITLLYYDKAYLYGLKKKIEKNLIYLETDTDDIEINSRKILEASEKINWETDSFIDS